MNKSFAGLVLGAVSVLAMGSAHAGNVYWSIGISAPAVGTVISNAPIYAPIHQAPPVYGAAPVYGYPPPVVYQPAPVLVYPAPVRVMPPPVVYYPAPHVVQPGFGPPRGDDHWQRPHPGRGHGQWQRQPPFQGQGHWHRSSDNGPRYYAPQQREYRR